MCQYRRATVNKLLTRARHLAATCENDSQHATKSNLICTRVFNDRAACELLDTQIKALLSAKRSHRRRSFKSPFVTASLVFRALKGHASNTAVQWQTTGNSVVLGIGNERLVRIEREFQQWSRELRSSSSILQHTLVLQHTLSVQFHLQSFAPVNLQSTCNLTVPLQPDAATAG